ncbi:MAG: DinB family protein [Anaerolineae bacterium]|nr:DinB family protein [Anaerolineae bacterium]MCI0608412.1 DinB family protein [Anaerolineae bacterium]
MEFQTLYQELSYSTEMIRALLAGISQEEAQIKPNPESWSILEVVCHLYDEEREDFREHLDFILHRQHEEWHQIDPDAWVTEREYNKQSLIEMQEKFFAERWKSLEWLKGLSETNWDTTYTSQYGSIKAGDMFVCWIAHDNLHVRQITELRRNWIERMTQPYDIEYAGDW